MKNPIDEYLKTTNIVSLYPKFSELIALVYRKIGTAFRSGATVLTVTDNFIYWYKEQELIGSYQGPGMPPRSVRYDDALLQILRYDKFIQKYVHIVDQSDAQVTCRLEREALDEH